MSNTQEPIRVLCVFSWLDRGGAETMCMELYRHIDHSRVQFDFVKHTSRKGAFEDEIHSLGGHIYEAPRYGIVNHFAYCRWWERHLSAHPEHQIIHGHFFGIAPVYFGVCRKMGRITVGHSHCTKICKTSNLVSELKQRIKLHILKKLERRSDYCFACSKEAGEWLFPNKGFTVLNNAIDVDKFSFSPQARADSRGEFDISDNSLVVGTVGRMTLQKNPIGIIEIFSKIHQKDPNARLLWVGDGEMRAEIENRIQREGLSSSVILPGVRSDVNRLYQAMDVFIFPSLWEGLGIVAIEAQTSGLPCFCSEAVPREAAVTDLCRFLPLNQPELWAEQILSANMERKDMSGQVKKAGYDIGTTSKWLEEFYCDVQCGAAKKNNFCR